MEEIIVRYDNDGNQEVVIKLESGMTVIARQSSIIVDDWEDKNEVSYDEILSFGKNEE